MVLKGRGEVGRGAQKNVDLNKNQLKRTGKEGMAHND